MTTRAVLAEAMLPAGSTKPEWSKGRGQTKGSPALHQCALVVLVHLSSYGQITEEQGVPPLR